MFERFTDRARRVVVLAQEEARILKHNHIGTEHILLGLLHEGEGLAATALEQMDIALDVVREQVREIIGEGPNEPSGHIPFTPRAKKVLELSLREALQLGHNYIGTEHILLGLIREGEGVAAQVLVRLGADLNRVRQQVIRLLRGYGEAESPGLTETVASVTSELTGRLEGPMLARFRIRLRMSERRLAALEGRIGTGPDETQADAEIGRVRAERQAAAEAQDYERAAALRDTERDLVAARAARKESWSAQNPSLPELAETVRQLAQEVERLSGLLRERGDAEPGGSAQSS